MGEDGESSTDHVGTTNNLQRGVWGWGGKSGCLLGGGGLKGEGGGGVGQPPPPCLCTPKCITVVFVPFCAGFFLQNHMVHSWRVAVNSWMFLGIPGAVQNPCPSLAHAMVAQKRRKQSCSNVTHAGQSKTNVVLDCNLLTFRTRAPVGPFPRYGGHGN